MRFFFDVRDGENTKRDGEGTELPDPTAARNQAIALLPELAKDALPDGASHEFSCTVRDENQKVIFTAQLTLESHWVEGAAAIRADGAATSA